MTSRSTALTRDAGIEVPLICGAMYPCSNPELVAAVGRFREHAASAKEPDASSGSTLLDRRRRDRVEHRLRELAAARFLARIERDVLDEGEFARVVDRIARRDVDPYTAASELLARVVR